MTLQSLHVHTTFDDGKNTPEEMVLAALAAGLPSVGISAHSPIAGEAWCVPAQRMSELKAELRRLREKYAGRIAVYCGLEYDSRSAPDFEGFDYVIGSVHFLGGDRLYSCDNCRGESEKLIAELFDGDADAAAAEYFAAVARCAAMDGVDIVGHFDLITKFDEPRPLYDTKSPAYRSAALGAMETLTRAGKIFEINMGAISRGYRTSPYPAPSLLRALFDMGGRVTVSSDAHSAAAIAHGFASAEALAKSCGFKELWQYDGESFKPTEI